MIEYAGSARRRRKADHPLATKDIHDACPRCHCAGQARPKAAVNALSIRQEESARDYILKRLPERILLKDIARHCKLPGAQFANKFKKSLGVSYRAWIQEQRIILAMSLFQSGSNDISQVAMDCGFFDQSHFNRVFKKLMGNTPGAWLRTTENRMNSYKN